MNKTFISIALLSGMMLASSCTDKLEIEQKATSSTASFYKTDADAESALTAMYATYISEIGGTEGIWSAYVTGINYASDDIFAAGGDMADHSGFRELNEMRYDKSAEPVKVLYNHIYKSIYSANLIIEYFGGEKAADTPFKKQAVAEARVMRAWAHMLAAQVYYQPPLIEHLITTEKPTNAESQKAIFDWCVDECVKAIPDLPDRKKGDKEGVWRATKGFAQFVGGKSALFAGEYSTAADIIKPLVTSDNYSLVPGERFRDLFHVEGDGCEEKIFELNFSANLSLGGEWGGNIQRGRWMVSNVLNWRGDDIVGENGADKSGTAPKICSVGGWGGGAINQDFAHKMLANDGDSYRRKATFLTSDEFFYDEDLCGWASDDWLRNEKGEKIEGHKTLEDKKFDIERGIRKSAGSFSRSDVMEVKMMMHPNDRGYNDGNNNTNITLARLGEAYLIYAEACLAKGEKDEALIYVNKIQRRAGSKNVTESIADLSLQTIQDEKQYELWFEGCRWFDIVRWGIAKECYDKVLDNIPLQWDEFWETVGHDADGSYIVTPQTKPHKLRYEIHHPFAASGIKLEFIKGKHEYWPLPQTVIEVNDQMHQVRGWAE